MSAIPFRLTPFAATPETLNITGTLAIAKGEIVLTYLLEGDLTDLHLPRPSTCPERRDLLWQTTCLELFVAQAGGDDYWEFNLSPTGDWNVYHLERYRQGLTPEPAYTHLPFQVQRDALQMTLTLRCPLPPALAERPAKPPVQPGGTGLEVGITAVVQATDGTLSYWALNHPGPEADFHHRGGFRIKLP